MQTIKEAPGLFYTGDSPDKLLSYLEYRMNGAILTILYVEVDIHLRGHGIGRELVAYAVDYARRNALKVNAVCSYARSQLGQHPEYRDVLDLPAR